MQTTDVRQAAQGAVDQSKSFLSKQVDERSTLIGQQIGSVADELRNVGQQLGASDMAGPVAGYVNQGADIVARLGTYLQDADSDRLIRDLEALARERPWAVAGAALVLGFAASRFLKTSSARRYRTGDTGSSSPAGSYGGGNGYGSSNGYGTRSVYGEQSYAS